ncbi:MAG: MFS transporter [Clostridiales bacterium]|nr:MFS transporter [Clostridiales bacterium]
MKKNKYLNGILPTILINFSIGTVYCWTLFKEAIWTYTGFGKPVVEWCFSLAIFFLGMSAAFGGKIVEKDVKKSTLITFVMVTLGWIVTGVGIQFKSAFLTVLGFGVIQGIGVGFGYITPVKTMMLWLDKSKGFAAGISIAGFALAGLIANPMIVFFLDALPEVYHVFYLLTGIYAVALLVSYFLIHRPEMQEPAAEIQGSFNKREIIFSKKFILLWLVFFMNIVCGLALISQEKQIYRDITGGQIADAMVVLYCTVSVICNTLGRITMASLQDKLKRNHLPYYFMALMSLGICALAAFRARNLPETLLLMWIVNFFFGCGFGCLPNILHEHYGIRRLATVQGLMLSAWAVAGLAGNQFAMLIIGKFNLHVLYACLAGIYALQFGVLLIWDRVVRGRNAI